MRFVYVSAALMILIVSSTAAYGCGGGSSGEDPCITTCRGIFKCAGGEDAAGLTCADFCAGIRANNPAQCRDKIDAYFACAADVTYTCTSNGGVTVTPEGGCAAEGQACAACTGKALCYMDLGF